MRLPVRGSSGRCQGATFRIPPERTWLVGSSRLSGDDTEHQGESSGSPRRDSKRPRHRRVCCNARSQCRRLVDALPLRPAHPRQRGEAVPLLVGVLMALGREVHRPQRLNSEEPGPPLSSPRGSHRAGYYLVGDHPMCDVVSHRAGPAVCASHSTTASGIRTVPLLVSDFQSTRNPLLEAGPGPVRASWTPSS